MFTLAFHIVAIGIMVAMVWATAYSRGLRTGERRLRRQLEREESAAPPDQPDPNSGNDSASI